MRRLATGVLAVAMGWCLSGPAPGQPYPESDQHNPPPQRPQVPPPTDPPVKTQAPDASQQDQEYLEYLAALKRCQQLTGEQRGSCIRETKQHFDRM